MANHNVLRGSDDTLKIAVNGEVIVLDLKSWKVTPQESLDDVEVIGEKVPRKSYQYSGHDFELDFHEQDARWHRLRRQVQKNYLDGLPPPVVNVIVITRPRKPGERSYTHQLLNCSIRFGEFGSGGQKEMKSHSISGFSGDVFVDG